ncbi:dihydroorotate dehydrogenase (quinone), partial [Campylobacter jejuni]
ERIKNGANLVQVYTALIFKGPSLVKNINQNLIELLRKDGFLHISEAVGVNLK